MCKGHLDKMLSLHQWKSCKIKIVQKQNIMWTRGIRTECTKITLFPFFHFYVCVHKSMWYVCVYMLHAYENICVWVHMCIQAHGGSKVMSEIIFHWSSTLFLRQGIPIKPRDYWYGYSYFREPVSTFWGQHLTSRVRLPCSPGFYLDSEHLVLSLTWQAL